MLEFDESIDTIASGIVERLELPDWEEYPEIGENDWNKIERECRKKLLAAAGHVTAESFQEAYALLEGRAG